MLPGGDARLAAATTFSRTARNCCFWLRLGLANSSFSSRVTTWPTMRAAAAVPRTSLVWPSNCGSDTRTVTTAVSPSRMSSLVTGSSPFLSRRVSRNWSLMVRTSAFSNPATCVPPLGVAITLTNERTVVS